jgi:hypothetical protein
VDAAAGKVVDFFGAFVPTQCRAAALQLVCRSYFPSCAITGTGIAGACTAPSELWLWLPPAAVLM